MATPLFFEIHHGSNGVASATTTAIGIGAISVFQIGQNNIVRIVATTAVNVRFGDTNITTATAQDVLVPANTVQYFDMGTSVAIAVFAVAASSVNISIVSRT